MFPQSDDEQLGLIVGLVFSVVAMVLALVIATALQRGGAPATEVLQPVSAAAAAVLAAPAAAPAAARVDISPSAQATSDAASITVEYGVLKFYFASGQAELAGGAGEALVDVVRAARSGKKVVIAGFHDAKGNAASNAELARQRALAVRDALKAAGVADANITLKKPEQLAGTGSDAEARRVEITLQ